MYSSTTIVILLDDSTEENEEEGEDSSSSSSESSGEPYHDGEALNIRDAWNGGSKSKSGKSQKGKGWSSTTGCKRNQKTRRQEPPYSSSSSEDEEKTTAHHQSLLRNSTAHLGVAAASSNLDYQSSPSDDEQLDHNREVGNKTDDEYFRQQVSTVIQVTGLTEPQAVVLLDTWLSRRSNRTQQELNQMEEDSPVAFLYQLQDTLTTQFTGITDPKALDLMARNEFNEQSAVAEMERSITAVLNGLPAGLRKDIGRPLIIDALSSFSFDLQSAVNGIINTNVRRVSAALKVGVDEAYQLLSDNNWSFLDTIHAVSPHLLETTSTSRPSGQPDVNETTSTSRPRRTSKRKRTQPGESQVKKKRKKSKLKKPTDHIPKCNICETILEAEGIRSRAFLCRHRCQTLKANAKMCCVHCRGKILETAKKHKRVAKCPWCQQPCW